MRVPPELIRRWMVDLTVGVESPPADADHLKLWQQIKREIAEIKQKGGIVDIPGD